MLIENNLFNNSGKAIELFDGTPAPAFKSIGNSGTASNINSNQGSVFTPPYTLSLKMNASEVESKVKPSAGNTLTLGTTGTSEMFMVNSDVKIPHIVKRKTGWTLKNPSSRLVHFCVTTLNGKTMLPYSQLNAGKSYLLPKVSVPLLVKFKEFNTCTDLYIPE